MKELIERIKKVGILPVIAIEDAADAVPLAQALKEGGLAAAEVTFRTEAAEEAIRAIAKAFPDFLLLAGTVLTSEQADAAVAAGAQGVVSPGFNPRVVEYCLEKNIPIIPGVCTPSEVEVAMDRGLTHLKFFPAEAAGGIAMIRALSAPYRALRLMPTGGVTEENLKSYLSLPAVFAVGGSYMVKSKDIQEKNFKKITELTRQAMAAVKEVSHE